MKRNLILGLVALGVFVLLALSARIGYAEPNAAPRTTGYTIDWYTMGGGGAQNLQGAPYSLNGTIGQFDVGSQSGTGYTLNSGYWVELFGSRLYLPLIMR